MDLSDNISDTSISGIRAPQLVDAAGPAKEDLSDLGFGSRVAEQSRMRLLNRDGSFNVQRIGLSFLQSLNLYHSLLTISWWKYYAVVFATYIVANLFFASVFIALGPGALGGIEE